VHPLPVEDGDAAGDVGVGEPGVVLSVDAEVLGFAEPVLLDDVQRVLGGVHEDEPVADDGQRAGVALGEEDGAGDLLGLGRQLAEEPGFHAGQPERAVLGGDRRTDRTAEREDDVLVTEPHDLADLAVDEVGPAGGLNPDRHLFRRRSR